MKELHEFRLFEDAYSLLPQPNNAKFNGTVYVLKISNEDSIFQTIGELDKELKKENKVFFIGWQVKRIYTRQEFAEARLFHLMIRRAFEPVGEECGTVYEETCEICGANRRQIGPLRLRKSSIPRTDIARSIAGEVVVSEKFADAFKRRKLKGIDFESVISGKKVTDYYQPVSTSPKLEITDHTVVGWNPFELSFKSVEEASEHIICGYKVEFERTVYRCPLGHLLGPNLISEPYVRNSPAIDQCDFCVSDRQVGAKQGVLRPEPIYFCSPAFRKMVIDDKLTGFEFEIAHVE